MVRREHRGLNVPAETARAWRGHLWIGTGTLVFSGPGGTAARHAHHATQLAWALDQELTVTFETPLRRTAVLVPANTPHQLDARGGRVVLLFSEPHSIRGSALDRRARSALGAELAPELRARFPSWPGPDAPAPDAPGGPDGPDWSNAVIGALGVHAPGGPCSLATRRAIAYVVASIRDKPALGEAARLAGLSPTRLTHVFTREVGVPFRRFVLWTRLARVVASTRAGRDLGRAAIDAGFSDAAHLSRTFRAMFGIPPSQVLPFAEIVGPGARAPKA